MISKVTIYEDREIGLVVTAWPDPSGDWSVRFLRRSNGVKHDKFVTMLQQPSLNSRLVVVRPMEQVSLAASVRPPESTDPNGASRR